MPGKAIWVEPTNKEKFFSFNKISEVIDERVRSQFKKFLVMAYTDAITGKKCELNVAFALIDITISFFDRNNQVPANHLN